MRWCINPKCGVEFESSDRRVKTCTPECAKEVFRIGRRAHEKRRRKARKIDDPAWRERQREKQRYKKLRHRGLVPRICIVCGAEHLRCYTGHAGLTCSPACTAQHKSAERAERRRVYNQLKQQQEADRKERLLGHAALLALRELGIEITV
jgi:hypothetical protein